MRFNGFPDHVPWIGFLLSPPPHTVNFAIKRTEKERAVLPAINRTDGTLQKYFTAFSGIIISKVF